MSGALTSGVHHVGLAVSDLEACRDFFCDVLGWKEVGRKPENPAAFVSDGSIMLTLWRVADPATATPFDRRKNIGLHHLALTVADASATALDEVYERVRKHPKVVIEFEPSPMHPGSATRHFICSIPGGIRIEFATGR
jgi:catechol 2,3-dioxygenase-like lactoylglutathione lyase family enzyme